MNRNFLGCKQPYTCVSHRPSCKNESQTVYNVHRGHCWYTCTCSPLIRDIHTERHSADVDTVQRQCIAWLSHVEMSEWKKRSLEVGTVQVQRCSWVEELVLLAGHEQCVSELWAATKLALDSWKLWDCTCVGGSKVSHLPVTQDHQLEAY